MASHIEELARTLDTNTRNLSNYLRSANLPFPSFDPDGPVHLGIESVDAEKARQAAIEQCMELLDLLQGPRMCLRPCYNATSLHAIYKYGVASKVPLDGEVSFSELAAQCGLYEPDLRRIIRFAIVYHRLFREPREGYVAHSAASKQLAENRDVQDGIGLMFDDFYPSFARTVEAMESFQGQEPNQTGWALAHNSTHQNIFEYLSTQPARASRFGGAMKFFSETVPGNSPSHLIANYPWASLAAAIVVDIGGSDGYISVQLARAFPRLRLIVQDLPETIASAADKIPPELKSRVELQAHDFFTEQPEVGADVYFFRWVLHDWPDNHVVTILRQLIPALKVGARIVVNDNIGPGQSGSLPLATERFVRELDMIMLSAFNSYEREKEDWRRLFREADSRFGPVQFTEVEGTLLGLLEITWKG